ncbi:hypothetical protein L2E82_10547 [Cichorium intybus]|uniref:Uncharacterized protein n=1 Tax=Cichorium intybus TaxID=13427 RepID=A0ACB9GAQ7_CICIN|nr:hypothetical protein L2E82_10547 [Cichorium intybus]
MGDGGGWQQPRRGRRTKQDRVFRAVSSNERSYADVVQPKVKSIVARESDDMLQLKVGDFVYDTKDTGKMIMAKVKSIDMLAVIINRCKVQGFPEVEVKYLGGRWILLEFQNFKTCINFRNDLTCPEWFSELSPWNRDFVCDERLVWLDIEGMPLRSWCKSNFEKVVNRWGQVIYMDGTLGISLAVQRLCVETKVMGIIAEEMTVMIDNHVFVLRIREAAGWLPTFSKEEDDVNIEDEQLLDANDFSEDEEDDLFHSEYLQDDREEKTLSSDPFQVRHIIEEDIRNIHASRKKEDNGGMEVIDEAKLGDVNITQEGNNQVDRDVSLAPLRTTGFEYSSNSSDDPSHPPVGGE